MIQKSLFGKLNDGKEIFIYSLRNKSGTQVKIIDYGAIVTNLFVKDKNGKVADIVMGYDSLQGYINDNSYLGAIAGRYGNRIAKGKFKIGEKEYQLSINDGKNHLHGGSIGFNKVFWDVRTIERTESDTVELIYVSRDGEEGYPGTLKLKVIYSLNDEDAFIINYEGETDKTTILNPTHHSYFNLTGDFRKSILNHQLQIDADNFISVDKEVIPFGEINKVENTPMDFRISTQIALRINDDYEQLKYGRGYNHNWVLNNYDLKTKKVAALYEPDTGRFLEVLTDQPGLQFYSGNYLDGTIKGKGGIKYQYRTGLCLETQHFPDSPNNPSFPSVILTPGEIYRQTTIYKFSFK
jgi:aldose 1-epimerase